MVKSSMKTVRTQQRRNALYATLARESRPGLSTKISTMPMMIKDVVTGRWGKGTNARSSLLLAAGAFLYLLSPIDILPEAILLFPGFLDDAAIAVFATSRLLATTEDYMAENGYREEPIKVKATRLG